MSDNSGSRFYVASSTHVGCGAASAKGYIFEDNIGDISNTKDDEAPSKRSRNVDITASITLRGNITIWVKGIEVIYVPSKENPADLLTKNLDAWLCGVSSGSL